MPRRASPFPQPKFFFAKVFLLILTYFSYKLYNQFIYLQGENWWLLFGNNRLGKTRNLVKKIRDTKGTFHAKMGSIKDRNGMDLTEAEDIQKRWQEYIEELYKKDLHDPETTMVWSLA